MLNATVGKNGLNVHLRGFNFSNVVCLVIDEADRMLSIGFEEEMKAILRVRGKPFIKKHILIKIYYINFNLFNL